MKWNKFLWWELHSQVLFSWDHVYTPTRPSCYIINAVKLTIYLLTPVVVVLVQRDGIQQKIWQFSRQERETSEEFIASIEAPNHFGWYHRISCICLQHRRTQGSSPSLPWCTKITCAGKGRICMDLDLYERTGAASASIGLRIRPSELILSIVIQQ